MVHGKQLVAQAYLTTKLVNLTSVLQNLLNHTFGCNTLGVHALNHAAAVFNTEQLTVLKYQILEDL
jgi:hypothetical protein